MKRDHIIALMLFSIAFLYRLAIALPGIQNPELLMRPDSFTYLAPAQSLLEHWIYGNDGIPTALRVPLYPSVLVPFLWMDGGSAGIFCIIANILFSTMAVPAIWYACREVGLPEKYSAAGTSVYLLTPTPAAVAPMFLSDGIFGTVAALELLLLIRYSKSKDIRWLYIAALIGGLGVLTRPLNLLWIAPCLFSVWVLMPEKIGKKLLHCGISFLIFCAVFMPWIIRNHANDFGWRIDAVSADSLKHNAAVVESRITGKPAQIFRNAYEQHFQKVFSEKPELFQTENSRLTYQEQYLSAIIKRYPLTYFRGFFHPVNYVPDVPSFLENLGLTQTGRGTWDVIINRGLFAGVDHYFSGNYWLSVMLAPLCLILLVAYFLAIFAFFKLLCKKMWVLPLLFLPMGLYYMTVTGPVAYPRFSLPVLPYISLLAAAGLFFLFRKREADDLSERND